jgi:hypothetical protein
VRAHTASTLALVISIGVDTPHPSPWTPSHAIIERVKAFRGLSRLETAKMLVRGADQFSSSPDASSPSCSGRCAADPYLRSTAFVQRFQKHTRQSRRCSRRAGRGCEQVTAIAVPGPLFMSSDSFSRDRLRNLNKQILPGGYIQFPLRWVACACLCSIGCHNLYMQFLDSQACCPFLCREESDTKRTPPLVRVRLSVHYRVHSRQMLCVGGSQVRRCRGCLPCALLLAACSAGPFQAPMLPM